MLTLLHRFSDGSCRCVCHLVRVISFVLLGVCGLNDGTVTQRPRWHHHVEKQSLKSQVVSGAAIIVRNIEVAGGLEVDDEENRTNF